MTSGPTFPMLSSPDDLVDRSMLRQALAPHLRDERFELNTLEPVYVRAKRGTSATIGLILDWRSSQGSQVTRASLYLASADRVGHAAAKAGTLRLVAPAIGPSLAVIDDPSALFLAFPNDRTMRGLSAAADPRRLKNRLHAVGVPFSRSGLRVRHRGSQVWPVRWKPGRRAVLCAHLGLSLEPRGEEHETRLFLRVYPTRGLSAPLARWRAAQGLPVKVPRVVAVDSERGFFAVQGHGGSPELALADPRSQPWSMVAGALGALYQTDPAAGWCGPIRSDRDDLESARVALRDLATWDPEIAAGCRELKARLAEGSRRLGPAPVRINHGDLTTDQVLIDRDSVSFIDWDEAAPGDPHADMASLAVDLEGRHPEGAKADSLETLSATALGGCWSAERWRWHVALAHARRSLSGLQSARQDWRARARRAVEEALRWSSGLARPAARGARRSGAAGATTTDGSAHIGGRAPGELGDVLCALVDRERRSRLTGVEREWELTAVWPDRDGAQARFEDPSRPGVPVAWLHMNGRLEVWEFPRDPQLTALADLYGSGRARVVGHRLGRRATLKECGGGGSFLHLRPGERARAIFERLQAIGAALSPIGLDAPRLAYVPEIGGWRSEPIVARPFDPASADAGDWNRLGRTLALVHAVSPPEALPHATEAMALRATQKQIALVLETASPFAGWLGGRLEAWRTSAVERRAPRATLVHGDLHFAQILTADHPVILDWEWAHRGDPEEDMGNLAAHLCWALGEQARAPWQALARGYVEAGGLLDWKRWCGYARLSLLRVLAVHSWRDCDRDRCLEVRHWERWPEECARW